MPVKYGNMQGSLLVFEYWCRNRAKGNWWLQYQKLLVSLL